MKNIIIGFSSTNLLLSTIIKKITNSKISHTYIRIPFEKYDTSLIFQASILSVNYENEKHFLSHAKIIEEYIVPITDEQWERLQRFRIEEVGKPYSYWQLLGFLVIIFYKKLFNKKIKNPFRNGKTSYVCSELIVDGLGMKEAEEMSPEDLRQWCIKNGRKILD